MTLLWESFWPFVALDLVIGGGAAWLSGRALARGWRPFARLVFYMALLAGAVRFFHYALFSGTLLSLHFYLVDFGVLLLYASLAYRYTRTNQMVTQYYWLYRRTGPFSWHPR